MGHTTRAGFAVRLQELNGFTESLAEVDTIDTRGDDTAALRWRAMIEASIADLHHFRRTLDAHLGIHRPPGGRPVTLPTDIATRIRDERAQGRSYAAIAAGLNADQIPTAQGGAQWWPGTVRKVAARSQAPA